MSEHTPGPWTTRKMDDSGLWLVEGDGGEIVTAETNPEDARLIAAAPDLLEAVLAARALFRQIGKDAEGTMAGRLCDTAIARAEAKGRVPADLSTT